VSLLKFLDRTLDDSVATLSVSGVGGSGTGSLSPPIRNHSGMNRRCRAGGAESVWLGGVDWSFATIAGVIPLLPLLSPEGVCAATAEVDVERSRRDTFVPERQPDRFVASATLKPSISVDQSRDAEEWRTSVGPSVDSINEPSCAVGLQER
jgi:hypothetical protein